jgi:CheY-like chemotaxis protein
MDDGHIQILLADDDNDDCMFFKEALEELCVACNLTIVNDGQHLMQLLGKNLSGCFDVLFLDLNMPRKNGIACLKEIKSSEKLNHLPVIIFSTSFDKQNADLLYALGAHHYICKPAEFSQLKKLIQQALALVSQNNMAPRSKENFMLNNATSTLFMK